MKSKAAGWWPLIVGVAWAEDGAVSGVRIGRHDVSRPRLSPYKSQECPPLSLSALRGFFYSASSAVACEAMGQSILSISRTKAQTPIQDEG